MEETCSKCSQCQVQQKLPTKSSGTWNWPSCPWKRLYLDYAGPFMNLMFLTVIDAHSRPKWLEVSRTSQTTTKNTIRCLNGIFANFGLAEHIVIHNGTCFNSTEFQDYLEYYGIRHTTVAPGRPASNDLAERYVGYFKQK